MQPLKAYLLCHRAESHSLYTPWLRNVPYAVVEEYDHLWQPPEDCGVVISHLHYDFPTASILKRITEENRCPVLVLADGVLEFRNTFQNPTVAAGSLFMPIHGHKMACIGESQMRHVAAWGNPGKTELVGLPRLDSFADIQKRNRPENQVTVLVMTARQPGFTDRQIESVQRAVVDLRNWFQKNKSVFGKTVNVNWRLTGELDQKTGVSADPVEEQPTLIDLLQTVDAVVTTPSTTVIESMALGLPTAVIDYTNSPKYVSTAWTISSSANLDQVMKELIDPPMSHMLFQKTVFADAVYAIGKSSARMVQLVHALIECRRKAMESQSDLAIPLKLLDREPNESHDHVGTISLKDVFPDQVGFRANEIEGLRTQYDQLCREVLLLQGRIDEQRYQLAHARQETRAAWRHHDYAADQVKWLRSEIQRLNLALRISRRPTRLQRRLRVRASIAFQRWQFFVEQVQKENRLRKPICKLDSLFEKTRFPKGVKLPVTVTNHEPNKRKNPQIKMWKQKPANSLLRRIHQQTLVAQKRLKARRVMGAR